MMKSNRKGGWVSLTLLHQMDHSVSAGRLLKYDIIRITAIFFVLLTHASGVLLFMFPDASTEEFRIANIFNGLSRCCIPMLVMLSGALLLDEDRKFDTRIFYRKHLLPILYLLAGWLFFYGAFFTFILPVAETRDRLARRILEVCSSIAGHPFPASVVSVYADRTCIWSFRSCGCS
jgi:hypothetical protein